MPSMQTLVYGGMWKITNICIEQNTETRGIPVGQLCYSSTGGVALYNGIDQ